MGNQEHFATPALRSSAFSLSMWKGSPGSSDVSTVQRLAHERKIAGERTTNSLTNSKQFSDREFGAFDTADNRPLAFILDGLSYDVGKVLRRGEGDPVIVAAI